jgi:hypothetical protein
MNPRRWNLKWVAAFVTAAAVGAIGVVVVLTVMGGGDGQATAGETTATVSPDKTEAEGTPTPLDTAPAGTPGATEATATPGAIRPVVPHYPLQIPTVPAGLTLAPKRPCPDKWQRISDDVLNYSMCIPPDWGILDERTGDRSTARTVHAQGLKILSPEGFPYPIGTPLDKPLQDPEKNLVYMTLGSAPPGSSIPCHVESRSSLGQFPAAQCQLRFNFTDWGDPDYRSDGTMVATEIIVPLANPEPGPGGDRTGYGLLIGMTGSEKAMEVHDDTISEILNTFEGQP